MSPDRPQWGWGVDLRRFEDRDARAAGDLRDSLETTPFQLRTVQAFEVIFHDWLINQFLLELVLYSVNKAAA